MSRIEASRHSQLSRRQLLAVPLHAATAGLVVACSPSEPPHPASAQSKSNKETSSGADLKLHRINIGTGVYETQHPVQWYPEGKSGRASETYRGEQGVIVNIGADGPLTDSSARDNLRLILTNYFPGAMPLDPTKKEFTLQPELLLPNYEAYSAMLRVESPQNPEMNGMQGKLVSINWQRKKWTMLFLSRPDRMQQNLVLFNHMVSTFRIISN